MHDHVSRNQQLNQAVDLPSSSQLSVSTAGGLRPVPPRLPIQNFQREQQNEQHEQAMVSKRTWKAPRQASADCGLRVPSLEQARWGRGHDKRELMLDCSRQAPPCGELLLPFSAFFGGAMAAFLC